MLRFDVFGTLIGIERVGDEWRVVYLGPEGKHRRADDIVVPPSLNKSDLGQYLADLRHEDATPEHPEVRWPIP